MRRDDCHEQCCRAMRRGVRFETPARRKKRDRDDAADQSVEIAQIAIPRLRKLSIHEENLRRNADGVGHQAHDQDNTDPRRIHCSKPQPSVAIIAAVMIQPHPGSTSMPGIVATRLARQMIGMVQPRISATNKPAKYPGRINLSPSSNPGGNP
jgi:hypothetical protein